MKKIITDIPAPIYSYLFPEPKEDIAFLDIETTGLSANASSLYLIGLMYFEGKKKKWSLCQWFADNYHSEKEMLQDFLSDLSSYRYLYHFNGKTFDIPYLMKKCTRHAVSIPESCKTLLSDTTGRFSIDLLSKIRSLRHTLLLEKCNQTSVERWLDLKRTDIFSGKDLISVYSEYMQKKLLEPENASKLEQVLLLHNHDDIAMMLELCSILTYDEYFSDACRNRLLSDRYPQTFNAVMPDDHILQLDFSLPSMVPKELFLTACYPDADRYPLSQPNAQITLKNTTATLLLPIYHGTLKYFIPNYKEYYYLPEEDTAMHKSVGQFVDKTQRRQATASTCYLKKTGVFLPSLSKKKKKTGISPEKISAGQNQTEEALPELFTKDYKDSLTFYRLPKDFQTNAAFWRTYLSSQLPLFRQG